MIWTEPDKLQYLLRLPWTIEPDRDEAGLILRVKELPGALATGDNPEELASNFWESLTETLRTYLHYSDSIPLPPGVPPLPWDAPTERALIRVQAVYQLTVPQDRLQESTAATGAAAVPHS